MSSSSAVAADISPQYLSADRGPSIVVTYWILTGIATIVVGLRFYVRYTIKSIGYDDWWMLVALVTFIATSGMVTALAGHGGFKHLGALSPSQQSAVLPLFWAAQPVGIFGLVAPRISIAILILRILPPANFKWQHRLLYFAIGTNVLTNLLVIILQFAQCNPSRALWMPGKIEGAKCWNPEIEAGFATFDSCWNGFVDAILALVPISTFSRLHLSSQKRLALCILVGLSLFACVSSIVKAVFIAGLEARNDLTWQTFNLFVWQSAEQFSLVVCGSVPPLKTLYDRITDGSFGHKRKSSSLGGPITRDSSQETNGLYYRHRSGDDAMSSEERIEGGNTRHVQVELGAMK